MGVTYSYLNALIKNAAINIFENDFAMYFNAKSATYQPQRRLHNYYKTQTPEYRTSRIPLSKIHQITSLRVTDYLEIYLCKRNINPNYIEQVSSAILTLLSNINCKFVILYNLEFILPMLPQISTTKIYMLVIILPKLKKEDKSETIELLKQVRENNQYLEKIVLTNLDVAVHINGDRSRFEVEIGNQLIYTDLEDCEKKGIQSLMDIHKALPEDEEEIPRLLTNNQANSIEFEEADLSIDGNMPVILKSKDIQIVGWPDILKTKVTQKLRILIDAIEPVSREAKQIELVSREAKQIELVSREAKQIEHKTEASPAILAMLEKYIMSCSTQKIIIKSYLLDLVIPVVPIIKPSRAAEVLIFVYLKFKRDWQIVDLKLLHELEHQMCYLVRHYEIGEMYFCVAYQNFFPSYYDFKFKTEIIVDKDNLDDENHITGLQEDFDRLEPKLKNLYKPPRGM